MFRENRRETGEAKNVAEKNAELLALTIGAQAIERFGADLQRFQLLQMLGEIELAIEHARSRNFFEQLRPANEQIARVPAGVERFHEQLEQLRVHDKQLEEHAAQPVRFDETDELIERHVRIGGALQPAVQQRP